MNTTKKTIIYKIKNFLTLKFKAMAKQTNNPENKEVNLTEETQKNLIDALVQNTSKLKILKTQLYLNDTHFINDLINKNEALLNSIK